MQLWRTKALYSEEYVRKTMPQTIGTFEMVMIVMVYMFTVTNPVGTIGGGAAALTYWIIGAIVFFIPTVIATTQLASMFPHEGSTYVWTHKALGGFWSFFASVTFWLPGILVMIGFAGTVTSLLQGLNSTWLTQPWQQGGVLCVLLVYSTLLSLQRIQVLLNVVRIAVIVTYSIVFLLGLAGVVWLLAGHHPQASFAATNWGVNAGNYGLFGAVVIAYLGIDAPFILAGERKEPFVSSRALIWGSLAIIAAYLIVSFALLVVEGPQNASQLGNFSVIAVIEAVFGKFVANLVAIGILLYFPVFLALNGSIFARLLMTTSIDRRLPIGLARLNKNRVPANAVLFQTIVMIICVAIAYVIPYIFLGAKPADVNNEILTIALSMMVVVWSFSTIFLFVDLFILYRRDPLGFSRQRLFPMPVLWFCIIVAPIACIIAIISTLGYSPLAQFTNSQWTLIVGGLTVACLIICAVVSVVATSEASWQDQVGEDTASKSGSP